jgi:hypothetical protein
MPPLENWLQHSGCKFCAGRSLFFYVLSLSLPVFSTYTACLFSSGCNFHASPFPPLVIMFSSQIPNAVDWSPDAIGDPGLKLSIGGT